MKAMLVRDEGVLDWAEVPAPEPGPGEVLIEIHAAGVNRADLLQRRGLYPSPPGAPSWMGLEAAGIVRRAGAGVTRWREEDRVCCLLAGGGYAEEVAVDERLVLPVPGGFGPAEAAGLPEVFATAYLNLFLEARLTRGETVLIHAAAGGVGAAAVQLARDAGARVLAVVGSEEKERFVEDLGAARSLNHRRDDLTEVIRAERPHVVLDCLGGEDLARHLPLLHPGGRWVVIGLMKGRSAALDLGTLLSGRLRVIGSALRPRPVEEKAEVLRRLEAEVWPKLASGTVRSPVYRVFPIAEAAAAHAVLERNENLGKVILLVQRDQIRKSSNSRWPAALRSPSSSRPRLPR